jgi:hypothetical protein
MVQSAVKSENCGTIRATEPRCVKCHTLQQGLQLELGPADDAGNLRRRRQLIECFVQFASEPSDFRFLTSN